MANVDIWEQRLYEVARDMLVTNYYNGMTPREAVAYAEALINELIISTNLSQSKLNTDL